MDRTAFTVGTNGRGLNVTWHFLATLVITAVGWGTSIATNNAKVATLEEKVTILEQQRAMDREELRMLRDELTRDTQELVDFHRDYSRDANRYIREPGDRR